MKEGKIITIFKKRGKNQALYLWNSDDFPALPTWIKSLKHKYSYYSAKINHLFFYEVSITVNNKLGKAFNKEMKVQRDMLVQRDMFYA